MNFNRQNRALVIAIMVALILTSGFICYLHYSLLHITFNLSGLEQAINRFTATVEVATLKIPRCESAIDNLPGGDPRREAMMLYVVTIVDLYKSKFGKLPDNILDLDKLTDFASAEHLNGAKVTKSCVIYPLTAQSYVLSCGAPLPPPKDLERAFGKNSSIQRFELVEDSEVLYVPGNKCA